MHVAVELSLYPLTEQFVPPILDFIARLREVFVMKVIGTP